MTTPPQSPPDPPPPTKSHGRLSIGANRKPRSLMDGPPRVKGAWEARVVTLFPEAFPGVLGASLTGKALADGLWALNTISIREFGQGRHRAVDDTPAGGGAGLVMRADVLGPALDAALHGTPAEAGCWPRLYLSPRGRPFAQADAARFAQAEGLTILCGRFEGIDERVIEAYGLDEISLGDFVLTGGEIAAQAVLDASVRLLPGVLGNAASTEEESFANGLLEHPHYTQPRLWQGRAIPEVLLSGHHGKIAAWRREMAERLTQTRRPDLWAKYKAEKDE